MNKSCMRSIQQSLEPFQSHRDTNNSIEIIEIVKIISGMASEIAEQTFEPYLGASSTMEHSSPKHTLSIVLHLYKQVPFHDNSYIITKIDREINHGLHCLRKLHIVIEQRDDLYGLTI